ncbi:hypothetical protein DFH09DRAFT_1082278 [Mycena vulgaris]|nr:hypothetical protein DFH09DRAFT_1082278 [Mycena vulgaris]
MSATSPARPTVHRTVSPPLHPTLSHTPQVTAIRGKPMHSTSCGYTGANEVRFSTETSDARPISLTRNRAERAFLKWQVLPCDIICYAHCFTHTAFRRAEKGHDHGQKQENPKPSLIRSETSASGRELADSPVRGQGESVGAVVGVDGARVEAGA